VIAGPEAAFDRLYTQHANSLSRQAFLLCGHRRRAERSVAYAFRLAWERWPEVAVAPDPAGWVRAAAYAYALSPWHGLVPGRRRGELRAVPPEDRVLLESLLSLPPGYRSSLVLHDGVGLGLAETARETEATAGATARRVRHAREALSERLPRLAGTPPEDLGAALTELLTGFAAGQPVHPRPASVVRLASERTTRRWTWAATALVLSAALSVTAGMLLGG
jgi:DNA-directed RNA polymerase specialized sigma24 family protein